MLRIRNTEAVDRRERWLAMDELIVHQGNRLTIECISGKLWVTYAGGSEKTLTTGQKTTVFSKEKSAFRRFHRLG